MLSMCPRHLGAGYDSLCDKSPQNESRTITVSFVTFPVGSTQGANGSQSVTYGATRLSGNTTSELRTDFPKMLTLRHTFIVVSASRPSLLVTLTRPTTPAGTTLLAALDGR